MSGAGARSAAHIVSAAPWSLRHAKILTRCAGGQFKSRDDHRRARELEEARKAGTIPAELDAEGKEINPCVPRPAARCARAIMPTRARGDAQAHSAVHGSSAMCAAAATHTSLARP